MAKTIAIKYLNPEQSRIGRMEGPHKTFDELAVSYLEVKLPSCVGNWNSVQKVANGETKEIDILVEDITYLAGLQAAYGFWKRVWESAKRTDADGNDIEPIAEKDADGDGVADLFQYEDWFSYITYLTDATTSATEIADITTTFGDAYVDGFIQDKEVIKTTSTDATAVEETAPRYGSIELITDTAAFKVYREDDTWGNFPEPGTNQVYCVLSADADTVPTSWGTSEEADGTADVAFTLAVTAETAIYVAVEDGTPDWKNVTIEADGGAATDLKLDKSKVSLISDVKTQLYVAAVPAGATSIKVTFVYA